MLDTLREVELDEVEAVNRICARMAVEAPMQPPVPETAALDRAGQTMKKPSPQPRPAPQREKRGKRRTS
jgi:hypothetical protein